MIDLVAKWIQTILQEPGDSPEMPYVLKTAFTGTAASNISGQTLTSTFSFGFNNKHQCFSDKERDRKKMQLRSLACVIIDEFSMVKADMLYMLDLRLQEIKENKQPFGGVAIFLFGDIFQLKPILGRYIFERPSNPDFHLRYRFNNLWEMFTVINLETNHRQGSGGEFANLLNRIRVVRMGEMLEEDIKTLEERVRPAGHEDLQGAAVNIICTRRTASNMNKKYLMSLEGEEIVISAVNYKGNQKSFKPPMHKSGDGTIGKTNFMNELKLKLKAKVMLIKNIKTEDSLTNGQTGVLVDVLKDKGGGVQSLIVKFDKVDAGKQTRSDSPQLEQKYPGATKIDKVLESYSISGTSSSKANLIQFPVVLSHAVTAHKTQGMTVYAPKTANMDLASVFEAAQAYVALGRTQELDQVYIISKLDPNKIYASPKALEEFSKMNARSVNQNPGVWEKEESSTVKIVSLNIARLEPHMESVKVDPTLLKADVIHLCETWVSPDHDEREMFQLDGFRARFVSVGKGKGLVTYTRNTFIHSQDIKAADYQVTKFSNSVIDSIHLYRSDKGSYKDLQTSLEDLIDLERMTVISGDFNICLDKEPTNLLTKFLQDQGFRQLVEDPTHVAGGRIDHIYLRDPENLLSSFDLHHYSPFYSDHDGLCLTLTLSTQVQI